MAHMRRQAVQIILFDGQKYLSISLQKLLKKSLYVLWRLLSSKEMIYGKEFKG